MTRTTDPEVQHEYYVSEMWEAMQLVYDQNDPHYALAFEAVRISITIAVEQKVRLSQVERLWAIAQKADAARPCNAAPPAPIIAANRRTS
ncbi:MAG TPA: hypothetical protein VGU69_02580 [Rhizomicrobium sp.]|nr:hypothetical protein [Rhizomicrobium sp.]